MSVFGHDRLGMELHALDGQALVFDAHDFAIVGPRGNVEHLRAGFALDHQRVVARHTVGRRQLRKYACPGVGDLRSLAVHQRFGMHDATTEGLPDGLMAQAHAKDW